MILRHRRMLSNELAAYREKYDQKFVKVDSYFLRVTGFEPQQTSLKLGEFYLSGVPAILSFNSVQMLFVLNAQEASFFMRFINAMGLLTVVFQRANRKDPLRIPLRVILNRVEPVVGRENLAMMTFSPKTEPGDWVEILGDYFSLMEYKLESWTKFTNQLVPLDQATATAIGYNQWAELLGDSGNVRVTLNSFTANKAFFADLPPGDPKSYRQLKLYFRDGPLILDGKLETGDSDKPYFAMNFHPKIVDAIEDYLFRLQIQERKKG